MNTASSLFALHQLELMTKPSDYEEIVITTDGNDIVVEEPKKETKAKPKKAKAKHKANIEENYND